MANRRGTAERAAAGVDDRSDGYVVPGMYRQWHRASEASTARGAVDDRFDPRFDDPDEDCADKEAGYHAAPAEARVIAEGRPRSASGPGADPRGAAAAGVAVASVVGAVPVVLHPTGAILSK